MTIRLLLVDDDRQITAALCRAFRRIPDLICDEAHSFERACRQIALHDYAVIISDFDLRDVMGNGDDVLRLAKLKSDLTTLVLHTGSVSDSDVAHMIVRKPEGFLQLRKLIEEIAKP